MACKCDKDKFKEEFIKEINDRLAGYKKETPLINPSYDLGATETLESIEKLFNKLWEEHMED